MHRSAEPSPLHAYIEYGSLCILLCMFKIDQEYHELHTLRLNRVVVLVHTLHLNRVLELAIFLRVSDLRVGGRHLALN